MKLPNDHNREQRAKRDRSLFAALVASPGSGDIVFPANASVYFRSVAGCAAGTTAASYNGRTIETPLLAAGQAVFAGFIERGTTVTPASGFEVLIDTGLGRRSKIGEGA
jgi:hypothetical protein